MRQVFDSQFLQMNYEASDEFMETVWITSTLMQQVDYHKLLELYLGYLQEYRPQKLLIDSRKASYAIAPEDQDWINTHIYPQTLEAGIQKIAFLVGEDIFMSVSLQQVSNDSMQNEAIRKQMNQQFFNNYEEAKRWLFS